MLPATEAVRLLTDHDPVVLALSGAINFEDAEELKRVALSLIAEHKDFQIDWSAAGYLSATAIQILLALFQAARAHGRSIGVVPGNQGVEKYLALAGLAECLKADAAPLRPKGRRRKGEKE